MSKPPRRRRNRRKSQQKKVVPPINSAPFPDLSGNTTLNPIFTTLHVWGDKNKRNVRKDPTPSPLPPSDSGKELNKERKGRTMRLEDMINDLKKEKTSKSKIVKGLDARDASTNQLILFGGASKQEPRDQVLKLLLADISRQYNLILPNKNKGPSRSLFGKSVFPPPPPPLLPRKRLGPPPGLPGPLPPIREPPPLERKKVTIDREIKGLDDLLNLVKEFPLDETIEYNINMKSIHDIREPLTELQKMVGMNSLKEAIVDQIVYFIQNLHVSETIEHRDFMHTVIYGPPGTGKTEVARIMGKIFCSMGILSRNKFKKATRSDLIAGYLGQTALKTRDVIDECLGGVLFIDEAYALGNPQKRDSFAKECIDTLCEALSNNKEKLMVIIAGYEKDLKNCFFAYNQGLDSRFPWRFKTDDYTAGELNLIFEKKIADIGWKLQDKIPDSWFENKMDYLKFYGRDIETILAKAKIAHARRVFCLSPDVKKKLTQEDIDKGFDMFISNSEVKERGKMRQDMAAMMYI